MTVLGRLLRRFRRQKRPTRRLKLMAFNVQDLFLDLAYQLSPADLDDLSEVEWQQLGEADQPLKPLAKLRGIARIFHDEQPDVAMLCEVGGPKALANFCRLFLADAYEPFLIRGNDQRGIDSGFLVKRSNGLRGELKSHKDRKVPFHYLHELDPQAHDVTAMMAQGLALDRPERRRLSRDMPELRLYAAGERKPFLVLLLAHLKSGFDSDKIDPGGALRRAAELKTLVALYNETRRKAGVPVIVAGDFNATASRIETSDEMAPLYADTDLDDVLHLAERPVHERITHITYFNYGQQGHARQLDYIFVPPAVRVVKQATRVYRYLFEDASGEVSLPYSMRDRWQLPSDHYPVIAVIEV